MVELHAGLPRHGIPRDGFEHAPSLHNRPMGRIPDGALREWQLHFLRRACAVRALRKPPHTGRNVAQPSSGGLVRLNPALPACVRARSSSMRMFVSNADNHLPNELTRMHIDLIAARDAAVAQHDRAVNQHAPGTMPHLRRRSSPRSPSSSGSSLRPPPAKATPSNCHGLCDGWETPISTMAASLVDRRGTPPRRPIRAPSHCCKTVLRRSSRPSSISTSPTPWPNYQMAPTSGYWKPQTFAIVAPPRCFVTHTCRTSPNGWSSATHCCVRNSS